MTNNKKIAVDKNYVKIISFSIFTVVSVTRRDDILIFR